MRKHSLAQIVLTVSLLVEAPFSGYAAGWIQSPSPPTTPGLSSGWWYGTNGDNTSWYAATDGSEISWYWIDGNNDGVAECYAFQRDGWMYSDTTTPDGYAVNAAGAWLVNGVVQTKKVTTAATGMNSATRKGSSGGGGGGGGGSHSSGNNRNPSTGTENPVIPDLPEKIFYSYTINLVDESGTILRSVSGKAEAGTDIALLNYKVSGYVLMDDQVASTKLSVDQEVFEVRYRKKQENDPINPDQKELYRYTIQYMDIESKQVLQVKTGMTEAGTAVKIEQPEFDGYRVCPDQKMELKVVSDNLIQNIYYRKISIASSSDTPLEPDNVHWTIHFVSEDDHNQTIWTSQNGEIQDEGVLLINFPEIVYGEDGTVWESLEKPPIERTICGPGNYIEYIEFAHTGDIVPDPDADKAEKKLLEEFMELARQEESNITNENPENIPYDRFLVTDQNSNDFRVWSIATQVNDTDSHTFYVIGKNFVPNGKTIAQWFGDEAVYSNLLEKIIQIGADTYYVSRMSIERSFSQDECSHIWKAGTEHPAGCLEKGSITYECVRCGAERDVTLMPQGHRDEDGDGICDQCHKSADGIPDRIHWNIGDLQAREIDGKTYMFRCIDQNYSDGGANHNQSALFLMESVIPANYGSDYEVKQLSDGSHKYVFKAGPVVNFGKSNDYKYSAIKKWLDQSGNQMAFVNKTGIGVDYAYMGKTAEQEFSGFDENNLKPHYIGNQKMTEPLFILSVDEAVKYREYLWKFDGSEEENPNSQYSAFSKGYWLRSPMGDSRNYDTDYVYVVDLVNGNIHPASIRPEKTGNDELDVTTTYGIRPAFTMPQD